MTTRNASIIAYGSLILATLLFLGAAIFFGRRHRGMNHDPLDQSYNKVVSLEAA